MCEMMGRDRRVARLPVDAISPSPNQPRRQFPQRSIEELADSIAVNGLLSPILVKRQGRRYELIAGERRLRAVKHLGGTQIDALILDTQDKNPALLTLIENLQREQLHYTEEADAYRRMIEEFAFTQESLARALGKSQSAIANKLRVNRLSAEVLAALRKTELTQRHARALLRLESAAGQLQAIARAQEEHMSVRQMEALVERMRQEEKHRAPCKIYLRDHRLLVNAITNTVRQLNELGVRASSRVVEHEDGIEVTVSLSKAFSRIF